MCCWMLATPNRGLYLQILICHLFSIAVHVLCVRLLLLLLFLSSSSSLYFCSEHPVVFNFFSFVSLRLLVFSFFLNLKSPYIPRDKPTPDGKILPP